MFRRIRSLFLLWRYHDETLATLEAQQAINIRIAAMANEQMAGIRRLAQEYENAADVWRTEVARMNTVAEQDARMIRALLKWCERCGCTPRPEDLKEFLE